MSLQRLIVEYLRARQATYRQPVCSRELSGALGVCSSYVRTQARVLVARGQVAVRRGPGGGYYLPGRCGAAVAVDPCELDGVVSELAEIALELLRASRPRQAELPVRSRTPLEDLADRLRTAVDTLQQLQGAGGRPVP